MLTGKTMGKLFIVCEWMMKLAYLNLLWFLFSIAGFLLFGIMPATVALFTIIRKWLMKETDVPVWQTFLTAYRREFKRANGLGICLAISGVFLASDFLFLRMVDGALQLALLAPLLIITMGYIIIVLYIFPVYVHYEGTLMDYLKNAFFIGVLNFHITLLLLAGLGAILFLMLYQPGLIPFFGGASMAWIFMIGGNYCFKRISYKKARLLGGCMDSSKQIAE
ncbi:YesL family protein [Neobacillus sp. OS1-2]|uniref:YesL family protein n=1 Tax=Neobacillus sp. OS1-2 TaxID=3070680 RepID=UPI0027E132D5|nr:YesL family protein [Neobacillus sp. OS1-2]WML41324.1 YesL family protein [Neobacillus sp. OS1-2]